MINNNKFIVYNDNDLRDGIKEWFCEFQKTPNDIAFIEFSIEDDVKIERYSANGFNNLLIVICSLKEQNPNIRIYLQLISNDILEKIEDNSRTNLRSGIKKLLIFLESLNLVDMLLKLGVVIRPSDEILQNLIVKLDAKKEERKSIYSSKILCLSPLINDSQEQYNLTFRMKTLMNILYWQLKDRINFREVEEASGQIMFELVKNIYQHSGLENELMINGFTCAQINNKPIIKLNDEIEEMRYTESLFLALSQRNNNYVLDNKNRGSFISITINDFGVGIHKRVMDKKQCYSIEQAIIYAFTTNFSSKIYENETEYWQYNVESKGIKLEHKGYGLLYCLMFVFKNLGRIKICSGNIEMKLFAKIEEWAKMEICKTPVDFLNMLNTSDRGYKEYFDLEVKKLKYNDFLGTQILIEIPTDNIYCRG